VVVVWRMVIWSVQVPLQHQFVGILPEYAATTIALLASSTYLASAIGSGAGALVLEWSVQAIGPAARISVLVALIFNVVTKLKQRPRLSGEHLH
jgi:predicted MFS family arabinose efflux permease